MLIPGKSIFVLTWDSGLSQFTGTELKDFEVVASNLAPPVAHGFQLEFTRSEYRFCARYIGDPPARPTVLLCESHAIGRYVYLYRKVKHVVIMCEFEAYGTRKFNSWSKRLNDNIISSPKLSLPI